MSDYWLVTVDIEGAGYYEEYRAEYIVAGRAVAERVVAKLRDRVESVIAEPITVYTAAAPVIRELSQRHGWLGLPGKQADYREDRERNESNIHHGEVIR